MRPITRPVNFITLHLVRLGRDALSECPGLTERTDVPTFRHEQRATVIVVGDKQRDSIFKKNRFLLGGALESFNELVKRNLILIPTCFLLTDLTGAVSLLQKKKKKKRKLNIKSETHDPSNTCAGPTVSLWIGDNGSRCDRGGRIVVHYSPGGGAV